MKLVPTPPTELDRCRLLLQKVGHALVETSRWVRAESKTRQRHGSFERAIQLTDGATNMSKLAEECFAAAAVGAK